MARWPKDNQAALIKFYGDPGTGEVGEQLVKIKPPFKMYYDGRLLNTISFHKKAAPSLLSALGKCWDYYDHDQAAIDKLGLSKTAGTYNPRKIRGSETKWSNHAYGAAIDINAEQNGFNVVGNIPLPMIAAFKSEGFRWGGDYKKRPDPMHFEACDSGEPERSFEEWLVKLGVKAKGTVNAVAEMDFAARPKVADVPDHVVEDFAVPSPKPPLAPPPAAEGVQGDPELWNVQRRLKAMGYNPGGLDGIWGGLSSGAVSGFINDRHLDIKSPTSLEMFHSIQEKLKTEISMAESDRFTRPIAPERAMATAAELAPKLPEVQAAATSERVGFWASIGGGITVATTSIGNYISDNITWLSSTKDFIGSLPWPAWAGFGLGVCGLVYFISFKSGQAKNAATQAYQEGDRV